MTLATSALKLAKRLGRADASGTSIVDLETEIKEEIGNAIGYYNRKPYALTEFRGIVLTTVASQEWYSTVDMTSGDGDQSNTRSSLDTKEILKITYMRENPGSSGLNEPLYRLSYPDFERLFEGSIPSGPLKLPSGVGIQHSAMNGNKQVGGGFNRLQGRYEPAPRHAPVRSATSAEQDPQMALFFQSQANGYETFRSCSRLHTGQYFPLTVIALQIACIAGDGYGRITPGMSIEPKHPRQIKGDAFTQMLPGKRAGRVQPFA